MVLSKRVSMTESGLDIDEEILLRDEEILLRLEANALGRCKSVCKSWNSLISSTRFINSHLNYKLKKKVENNEIGDTRIIALPGATRRHDQCQVVGSSNGLVCISRYSEFLVFNPSTREVKVFEFLVVNPSTREVKVLGNTPEEYRDCRSVPVSGFGYDSSIDDYKVVIGFMTDGRHYKYVFKVLTMKSYVWRSVALESDYEYLKGNGILCNGAIHWITSRNKKQVIVSFDLSKEVFKEIPQPKLRRSYWNLGTMKDCLCIFARPNINFSKNEDIEIWVMRSYNVQESWEQILPPPGYDAHKTTIEYTPRVLIHPYDYADIRLSTISECNYNYDEHVFVKSLVSPHGDRQQYE